MWSGSYATTVKRIRYLYVNLIVLIICALIWDFAKVSLDMSIVSGHLGYIIKKGLNEFAGIDQLWDQMIRTSIEITSFIFKVYIEIFFVCT